MSAKQVREAKLSLLSHINLVSPVSSLLPVQCLIIGVRKCGTRALLEMLYLHPRIQKAAGEVHFFDRDDNYLKGLDWYRKKMPHSFRGQITIEKSPSYFVTPEVSTRRATLTYYRWLAQQAIEPFIAVLQTTAARL